MVQHILNVFTSNFLLLKTIKNKICYKLTLTLSFNKKNLTTETKNKKKSNLETNIS